MQVYSFVMTLSKSQDISEEIAQKTFFKAMTSRKKFLGGASELTWLCAIAKNLYIDEIRSRKRVCELDAKLPSGPSIEHKVVDEDAAFKIHQVLHRLEEPYKEVFQLRVFGELSFQKIGKLFGKTENWARVTYHRARLKIQERMEHLSECDSCKTMLLKMSDNTYNDRLEKEKKEVIRHYVNNLKKKLLFAALCMIAICFFVSLFVNLIAGNSLAGFLVAAAAVLFGLSVIFLPFAIGHFPLSASASRHKGLLIMSVDTVLFYTLITACGIYADNAGYWRDALLISTVAVLFVWAEFAIVKCAKINKYMRAGLNFIVGGIFFSVIHDIIYWIIEGILQISLLKANLSQWNTDALINSNCYLLILLLGCAIGLLLFLIGSIKKRKTF